MSEATVAAVALAISLVALLTTVGQLLQQYLATADGYRRCQKSVMGEYAQKTRLLWRWREFRFETLYTTPEIYMSGDGVSRINFGQVVLTGSIESRRKSLVSTSSLGAVEGVGEFAWETGERYSQAMFLQDSANMTTETGTKKRSKQDAVYRGELSCWIPFLHWLYTSTQECLKHEAPARPDPIDYPHLKMRLPTIIFRERSWDFKSPDVVRPLAKTTLSDIAMIARRMGMRWKDFRPSDGILRAEGNSHTITSTVIRSLGIVLQYAHTGQRGVLLRAGLDFGTMMSSGIDGYPQKTLISGTTNVEQEEIYIPRARADQLGSGVLRTDPALGLPSLLAVSTQAECVASLRSLDRTGYASATLSKTLKENPEFRLRVADLTAFTLQPIRYRGSALVQIPAPSDNTQGVTTSSVGRRAFRQCLKEYIVVHQGQVGIHTEQALTICNEIGTNFAAWDHTDTYSAQDEQWVVTRDPRYLDILLDHIDSLTILLNSWEQEHSFRYINLLGIHIRYAMFAAEGETSLLRSWGSDYKADVDGYFRQLPKIIEEMKKTGFCDRQMIVDAWVTTMLRAMCWGACHFFVPGERVPIEFYGSQLPVYIG